MAKSVKALLNKKGWTGQEVGQLLIASALHDIKEQSKGQGKHKLLFTQEEFEKIESSLNTNKERLSYGVYRDIYRSFIDLFNRTQGLRQQFYNGFNYLIGELRGLIAINRAYLDRDMYMPLIMTKSQYDRAEKEVKKQEEAFKEAVYSLALSLIEDYVKDKETPPQEIKEALEATKEELATNRRILSTYCKDTGYGYYSLPDGRRSDQMEKEEWMAATLEDTPFTEYDSMGRPVAKLEGKEKAFLNTEKRMYRRLKREAYLYNNWEKIVKAYGKNDMFPPRGDEDEIIYLLEKHLEKDHPIMKDLYPLMDSKTTWHYYDTPDDLTKYELLYYSLERYQGILEGDNVEECYKEFIEDYPALFEALKAHIEKIIPQAKGLDPLEEFITWGELAALGIKKYKDLIAPNRLNLSQVYAKDGEDTTEDYSKRMRMNFSGIAIINDPDPRQVDENGDYIEIKPYKYFITLEEIGEKPEAIDNIHQQKDTLIYPALSYIYSYNALIKILGKVYDLPELATVGKVDTTLFEDKIEAYNSMLYHYFFSVYGAGKELEERRALIREIFTPLNVEDTKPPKAVIEAVEDEIQGLGLSYEARRRLSFLDDYINILMGRGEINE